MKTNGQLVLVLASVVLFLTAGCAETEAPEESELEQAVVELAVVEGLTLEETVTAIGSIEATEEVVIRPEVGGRIERINFSEGETVEAGRVLYELEAEELKQEVEAIASTLRGARSRLEVVEKDRRRQENLFERGLVPAREVDQIHSAHAEASSRVEELKARLQQARKRYEDSIVIAPISGYVSEIYLDTGNFVSSGAELAMLYRSGRPEVSFTVPERFSERVRPGQIVRVRPASHPGVQLVGAVYFVSPVLNPRTRSLLVKAQLDENEIFLRPGGFSHVELIVEERVQRPVIPEQAVIATRVGHMVFKSEAGIARQQEIEIGMRLPGRVEVISGLETGDTVVRTGHMDLRDGTAIQVSDVAEESK